MSDYNHISDLEVKKITTKPLITHKHYGIPYLFDKKKGICQHILYINGSFSESFSCRILHLCLKQGFRKLSNYIFEMLKTYCVLYILFVAVIAPVSGYMFGHAYHNGRLFKLIQFQQHEKSNDCYN